MKKTRSDLTATARIGKWAVVRDIVGVDRAPRRRPRTPHRRPRLTSPSLPGPHLCLKGVIGDFINLYFPFIYVPVEVSLGHGENNMYNFLRGGRDIRAAAARCGRTDLSPFSGGRTGPMGRVDTVAAHAGPPPRRRPPVSQRRADSTKSATRGRPGRGPGGLGGNERPRRGRPRRDDTHPTNQYIRPETTRQTDVAQYTGVYGRVGTRITYQLVCTKSGWLYIQGTLRLIPTPKDLSEALRAARGASPLSSPPEFGAGALRRRRAGSRACRSPYRAASRSRRTPAPSGGPGAMAPHPGANKG